LEHILIGIAKGNNFYRRDLNQSPQIARAIPTRAD
jgi:hypothetical protein